MIDSHIYLSIHVHAEIPIYDLRNTLLATVDQWVAVAIRIFGGNRLPASATGDWDSSQKIVVITLLTSLSLYFGSSSKFSQAFLKVMTELLPSLETHSPEY